MENFKQDIINKQKSVYLNIFDQFLEPDFEKGDYIGEGQVSERRHFKDGWYTKQADGRWKKDKNQEGAPGIEQNKPQGEVGNKTQVKITPKEGGEKEKFIKQQEEKTQQGLSHLSKFEQIKDHIEKIVSSDTPKLDQLKQLTDLGLTSEDALVAMTTLPLSQVLQYKKENNIKDTINPIIQTSVKDSIDKSKIPPPSAKSRWNSYEGFMDMILEDMSRSLLVYGRGGVGKTYRLLNKLKTNINPKTGENYKGYDVELDNLPQEYDYVKITGKTTPVGLFQSLYEHNGKLLIFDDCDSALEDKDSLMMLKAVLDTSGDQVVDYKSSSKIKDKNGLEIPQSFKFKGKVIFISNMDPDKVNNSPHLSAVKTRNLTLDLSMTADETMGVLKDIMPKMEFEDNEGNPISVSDETKKAVYDFIDKYKYKTNLTNLNARVFGNMAKIKTKYDLNNMAFGGVSWEDVALNLLTT